MSGSEDNMSGRQNPGCDTCLLGQIADNTDMLITAIGNLTARIGERLCKDAFSAEEFDNIMKTSKRHKIKSMENMCREERK